MLNYDHVNYVQMYKMKLRATVKTYRNYRVYKKKLHRFEIALKFAKQLLVSSFFMYIASLGTYNVEKWKKFLELKFCEPGGCVFSNKLKMACARNLKALIIF